MKVGTKLLLGFLVIVLMGAIVAGIGSYNMGKISEEADQLYQKELLGLSFAKEANINLVYIGRSLRSVLLASSEAERERFLNNVEKSKQLMHSNLDRARQLFHTERGKKLFAEIDSQLREYEPIVDELLKKARNESLQQNRDSVAYLFTVFTPKSNEIDDKLTELNRAKEDYAKQIAEKNAELYRSSRSFMIALVIGSAFVGIAIGILITRNLTHQLGGEPSYAAGIAERIAAGDLTVDVQLKRGDQSSLLYAMKSMRDSLAEVVSQVRRGTDTIASASSQIASGNMDLSSRTEEQASSLEETASSMEELTSTVKQNSDNARQANTLAMTATAVATRGGKVVSEVVDTMSSINDSSKKIVDIIGVIDSIAFQTNILALNAAVEAARAGEQGRGFAVVAAEVRTLAQRSAAAAKEIKELINSSVEKVDAGARLVDQAGATMQDILESIRRVTDIMGEITAASEEQTGGIEQINQAITQMDEVTQQNASLVEEAAAASSSLQDQANQLAQLVSVFKVAQQSSQNAAAPSRPAVPRPVASSGSRAVMSRPVVAKPAVAKAPALAPQRAALHKDGWEEF